jgi:ribosomal-protein-alanine N-acetyltransferase
MDALTRGRRVHLRRLAASDEDEFLERVRASTSLHRPWSHPPSTPAAFREHIDQTKAATQERLVVCRNEDGAIVGCFGLTQIFYGPFRNAYLGYFAFRPFAGRGYMREGIQLVLRFAFRDLGLHRVQASIQPENERSIDLVRSAGFRKEGLALRYLKIGGRWRDHEQWAITADEVRTDRRRT